MSKVELPFSLRYFIDGCGFSDFCDDLELEYRKHYSNHKIDHSSGGSSGSGKVGDLERRWYNSLVNGSPDYTVYNDPFYLCDLWLCWKLYSRKGLIDVTNPKLNPYADKYTGMSVLDLGCGLGITSALLMERIISSRVVGTNLIETFQYPVIQRLGLHYGFDVAETSLNLGHFDIIFASEYFEHIETPIKHLQELIEANTPSWVICANGFNGRAIGHFTHYHHLGIQYPASEMSRMFNSELLSCGFDKVKTTIWNNRPAVWHRTNIRHKSGHQPRLF